MRLGILLVAANLATLPVESRSTAAGWTRGNGRQSAAGNSRRVFGRHGSSGSSGSSGRGSNTCRVLAFGRGPSTRIAEKGVGGAADTAGAGEVPDLSAGEAQATAVDASAAAAAAGSTAAAVAEPSFAQGILNTVKGFLVDAKVGSVSLWTNFKVCQDIRKRVKAGHQLTYAEYAHLDRGSNDRRKLLQFVIIYAISPETFPYVILYVPSLLPSTFEKPHAVRTKYQQLSQERVAATLAGLSQVDKQLLDANAKLKGKPKREGSRPAKRIDSLESQREEALKILGTGSKKQAFELLQDRMVTPAPPALEEDENSSDKKKKRQQKQKLPKACAGLPSPATKALGKGMGLAGWRGIAPAFYIQYRLNDHLKELGKGDEILRRQALDSLSDSDLREACSARAIEVAGGDRGGDSSAQALRSSLAEWLELTSADGVAARRAGPEMVFLPDRARLLGLGLNFLENAREGKPGELSRKALLSSW